MAGGVSQQAPHLQFPGQVTSASNVDFDVAVGIKRRSGTRYVKRVTGLSGSEDYRLHPINRDNSEKYVMVYGDSTIRIWDSSGTEATVNITADAQTYLDANNANADDMRVVSIADYTILVNTTVVPTMSATSSYSLTGDFKSAQRMLSTTPAQDTYHRTAEDFGLYPAGYYKYSTGGATFPTAQFAAISGATNADPTGLWDTAGTKYGFKIRFQRRSDVGTSITWDNTAKTLTAGSSLWSQYVWQKGDQIEVTAGTGWTPGWYTVEERVSGTTLRLSSSISVANTADVATDGIGQEYQVIYDPPSTAYESMHDVASALQDDMWNAGATDALISWTDTGFRSGYFTITGRWRGSGSEVHSLSAPDAGITDLRSAGQPLDPTSWTTVAGTSVGGGGGVNSRIQPVGDRWQRVAAPNQPNGRPTGTTMPIRIVRTSTGPAVFTVDVIPWTDRLDGDENSNPAPSILTAGVPIRDVAFFRSRLVFAAGEHVVFSDADDIFNFFQKDVGNIVDSDPIDISVSSDQVCVVDFMVPNRNTISVFTKAGRQFDLSYGQSLTPSSAGFTQTTTYTTLPVRPVIMGGLIFFLGRTNNRVQLFEARYDDTSLSVDATDNAAHVPTLLSDALTGMCGHANTRTLYFCNRAANFIAAYRQFWDGAQKRQSAWTTYSLSSSLNEDIHDVCTLDNDVFFLMERASDFVLYRFPINDGTTDLAVPYAIHMDRIMLLTGSYNSGTGLTTWTLPDSLSDTSINRAVETTSGITPGNVVNVTSAGTTVTATGDYSAASMYLGRSFTSSVTLTRPYIRDERGIADTNLGLLQQRMILSHKDTGAYSVTVARDYGSSVSFPFTTPTTIATGLFQAWALGDWDRMTVSISTTGVLGMNITGIQYVVDIAEVFR